jgi:steroid delta-isomerase-like uncharacterized protein
MTDEEVRNKAVVAAAFEADSSGLEAVLETHERIYDPELVAHFPGMPPIDTEGHKQYSAVMYEAFPDLNRPVDDLIASQDIVVARWRAEGTHSGEFQGLPPTGRFASITGITIFRLRNGRIVEEWGQSDMLGLLQQLGALPAGGEPAQAEQS